MSDHYRRLERMFNKAPIQSLLGGGEMKVSKGSSEYRLEVSEDFFHAANAMHGAIYFKLLDDAAYFASASLEEEYFILTKSYQIKLRRPVHLDSLIARGVVTEFGEGEILADSEIVNMEGKVVASGSGVFVRGPKRLIDLQGYGT